MIRQLAHCESGGSGPSDRPIFGGRGAYLGRLQFTVSTVVAYQRKRDGTQLTGRKPPTWRTTTTAPPRFAKYMIFELEEPCHWPLCSRKIALAQRDDAISSR